MTHHDNLTQHLAGDPAVSCGNCGWTGKASQLKDFADIAERIAPGEVVPAGECPKCGSLCHLDGAPNPQALDKLVCEAVDAFPQFDDPEASVGGADLVEWFAQWRERAKVQLGRATGGKRAIKPAATVFVAHHTHKHGDVYYTFTSREDAQAKRHSEAVDNWDYIMNEPMPTDPDEMERDYYAHVSETSGESFHIEECRVEGAPMPWTAEHDKAPTLAIICDGGLVQDIVSTHPGAFGHILVIDYDKQGVQAKDLTLIPQADGSESEAVASIRSVDTATINLKEVVKRISDEEIARAAGWVTEEEYNGEKDGIRNTKTGDWAEGWAGACAQIAEAKTDANKS